MTRLLPPRRRRHFFIKTISDCASYALMRPTFEDNRPAQRPPAIVPTTSRAADSKTDICTDTALKRDAFSHCPANGAPSS